MQTPADDEVILNFLDFDGGFKKEPNGMPAFQPADPFQASQARMTLETLAARGNLRDRQRQRALDRMAVNRALEALAGRGGAA